MDEINRESTTDIYTIAVSYLLMFLYITLFLGHIRSFATIFVSSLLSDYCDLLCLLVVKGRSTL